MSGKNGVAPNHLELLTTLSLMISVSLAHYLGRGATILKNAWESIHKNCLGVFESV